VAAGTCFVTALQPGNATYSAAAATTQSFSIFPAAITNNPNNILAAISSKAGLANARQWTLAFTNQGSTPDQGVTITSVAFVQQGGPACKPTLATPLPVVVGNAQPSATISGTISIDFSSCAAASRFQATLLFTAYGMAGGTLVSNNQFQ
jgi:hypothetical protein